MSGKGAYIYTKDFLNYRFNKNHPFNPTRLHMTTDLLEKMNILNPEDKIIPMPATLEQLLLVHSPAYIDTVSNADSQKSKISMKNDYGLDTEENPIFPKMHEASSLIVGATIKAAKLVIEDTYSHALNIGGGLHHAHQSHASGFCIYNDAAVAIAWLKKKYQAKVLYIDTDAHHGDGVQWFFYSDPNVMTVSIHESGHFLFPGTGNINEIGIGKGLGYSINLPLEPYTDDNSYLSCLEKLIDKIKTRFKPDIIISQNGCDTHYLDPLTHLSVTTKTLSKIPNLVHTLAHEIAENRWVALGGGGYDFWRVVPRAWAFVWSEVSNRKLPEEIPQEWLEKWQKKSPHNLLSSLHDNCDDIDENPNAETISEKNCLTLTRLFQTIKKEQSQLYINQIKEIGPLEYEELEKLDMDPGLNNFREPEKQKQALLEISKLQDGKVYVAIYQNTIIGYITFHRPDVFHRWYREDLPEVIELGSIEISTKWRKFKLASKLLEFAFSNAAFEDKIVISCEYYWHWDFKATGLTMWQYRTLMGKLFDKVDFKIWTTDEPEIIAHPANMFSVRIGSKVKEEIVTHFKKLCIQEEDIDTLFY